MNKSFYFFNAHLDLFSEQAFIINKRKDSGVYFLHDKKEIIYVGKTDYLFDRPFSHKDKTFDKATGFKVARDWLDYLESAFVGLLKPRHNGFTYKDRTNHKDYGVNDKWAFLSPEIAIHVYKKFEQQGFCIGTSTLKPYHAHSVISDVEAKKGLNRLVDVFESEKLFSAEAACP